MTNTDTADVEGTAAQVAALARAGSELVRVTVNNGAAAAAVPRSAPGCDARGINVPLIGDFHYNGHSCCAIPGLRRGARQVPNQPRQCRRGDKRDAIRGHSARRARTASPCASASTGAPSIRTCSPPLMDENAAAPSPWTPRDVMREAMVGARSTGRARRRARPARTTDHALRQGQRRAGPGGGLSRPGRALRLPAASRPHRSGMGSKGIVASTAAWPICCRKASATRSASRSRRSRAATAPTKSASRSEILQTMGLRCVPPRSPPAPAAGAPPARFSRSWPQPIQETCARACRSGARYAGVEDMTVAVMGCVVNGPGESSTPNRHQPAPGTGERPRAPGVRGRREGAPRSRAPGWPTTSSHGRGLRRGPLPARRRRGGRRRLVGAGDDRLERPLEVVGHAAVGRLQAAHADAVLGRAGRSPSAPTAPHGMRAKPVVRRPRRPPRPSPRRPCGRRGRRVRLGQQPGLHRGEQGGDHGCATPASGHGAACSRVSRRTTVTTPSARSRGPTSMRTGTPLSSQSVARRPKLDVDAVVELARARRRRASSSAQPRRRVDHAARRRAPRARRPGRRERGRHAQPVVVAVGHDQPADHAGRRRPTTSSSSAAACRRRRGTSMSKAVAKFWPSSWLVPICSALPSRIIASQVMRVDRRRRSAPARS